MHGHAERSTYKLRVAIDVSECIILTCTRRPLQLHVADVIARLDNNPAMKMCSETTRSLARTPSTTASSINLHFLVLWIIIKKVLGVGLFRRIRC